MTQAQEIRQLPPEIASILKHTSKRLHIGCCEEQNDRYAVKLIAEGHGQGTLSMLVKGSDTWVPITRGGFELQTFIFDPIRSQVLYPATGKIVAFDLQTRQAHTVLSLSDPAINPWLLDETQDGTLLAYFEPGACLGKAQPHGQSRIEQPRRVCLVKLK